MLPTGINRLVGGLVRFDPVSRAASGEKLHVVGDDLAGAALLAFLVLVAAVLQPALDVERVALLAVRGGGLGQARSQQTTAWTCASSSPLTVRLVARRRDETALPVPVWRSSASRSA